MPTYKHYYLATYIAIHKSLHASPLVSRHRHNNYYGGMDGLIDKLRWNIRLTHCSSKVVTDIR